MIAKAKWKGEIKRGELLRVHPSKTASRLFLGEGAQWARMWLQKEHSVNVWGGKAIYFWKIQDLFEHH